MEMNSLFVAQVGSNSLLSGFVTETSNVRLKNRSSSGFQQPARDGLVIATFVKKKLFWFSAVSTACSVAL